ncbi:MAG: hypothetical protein AAFZ80_08420 [Cyanobacteria bacterium P01_A01_bin.105]
MAILILFLFLCGFVLALSGGIIGIVQAFQESATWGLLYLFVPFASLVFVIKFWGRKWVRNSLFLSLGGMFMFIIGAVVSPMLMQQAYGDLYLEGEEWEEGAWDEGEWDEGALADTSAEDVSGSVGDGAGNVAAAPNGAAVDLQPAFNLAMEAATLTQTAATNDDWSLVADLWLQSITLLEVVPEGDPNYAMAQTKAAEYRGNLDYAEQNSVQ